VPRNYDEIPWQKVKRLWLAGESYREMALAIGRYRRRAKDPTKTMRNIISRGIREGFTNYQTGEREYLPLREGMNYRATNHAKRSTR